MHHRRSHRTVRPSTPLAAGNRLQFETLEPRQVLSGVTELLLDINETISTTTSSSPGATSR